ncbi:class I SAM-dependent methyltransferase [Streptomyces toxytricini]|uniref:Class I SAM-dependent methyltransferase n=1 Tax=Streptomyces toxytricini TaxID=67369 RepID=A0ABW8EID2_STRT5
MSEPWGDEPLFGPFLAIQRQFPDIPLLSYYDADFFAYSREAAWPQEWDVPALARLAARVAPHTVVDVGCSDGRILWHLRRHGIGSRHIGLDASASARKSFEERFAGETGVSFRHVDVTAPEETPAEADLAVMGSVTVNSFRTREQLAGLLGFLHHMLRSGGHAAFLVYQDHVADLFRALGRAMDAVPFTDDSGRRRLIWRGIDFRLEHDHDLRQNYFIQYDDRFPGVLGLVRERVWTTSEVVAEATARGFELVAKDLAVVDDGGAEGWPCDALLLRATHRPAHPEPRT